MRELVDTVSACEVSNTTVSQGCAVTDGCDERCRRKWSDARNRIETSTDFALLCGLLNQRIGLAGCAYEWWITRDITVALSRSVRFLVFDFAGVFPFLLVALPIFGARTVYYDHTGLRWSQTQNEAQIAKLQSGLTNRQHNLSTTDAVFPNMIYMFQAFREYRLGLHGQNCVIHVTAPKGTAPLASTFAQLSNPVSDCAVFGPDENVDKNPDLVREATDGMVPDAIVLHAPKGDRAASQLFARLGNQIKLPPLLKKRLSTGSGLNSNKRTPISKLWDGRPIPVQRAYRIRLISIVLLAISGRSIVRGMDGPSLTLA
jgi:hypothetical protein